MKILNLVQVKMLVKKHKPHTPSEFTPTPHQSAGTDKRTALAFHSP